MGSEFRNPLSVLSIVILLFLLTTPTSTAIRGPIQWLSPPDHCDFKLEDCSPPPPQLGGTTTTTPDHATDQP